MPQIPLRYRDVITQLLFRGDVFRLHNLPSRISFLEDLLQLAYASLCILLFHGTGDEVQRLDADHERILEEANTTCMGAPTRVDRQRDILHTLVGCFSVHLLNPTPSLLHRSNYENAELFTVNLKTIGRTDTYLRLLPVVDYLLILHLRRRCLSLDYTCPAFH